MKQGKQMRALILEGAQKFVVKTIPIPKPRDGQVLIKVMAAPINPSDLAFLKLGSYSSDKKAPCTAGFQGSGIVVENGGGIMGWGLVNKKVAFSPSVQTGSYAQYAIASSSQCFPVDEDMPFEKACMSFVNPLTAVAMLDILKEKKAKGVILTAAASSLGRMLNRFLPPEGIQIINIVRREEQIQVLRNEGANYILNSTDQNFSEKLQEIAHQLKATVCFDAISGDSPGQVLKCMPKSSICYVYGGLSGEGIKNLDIIDILYNHKTVTGLFLPNWLEEKGTLKLLPTMFKLRKLLKKSLRSQIAKEVSIEEFSEGLNHYLKNMTKGKVIIKPWLQIEKKYGGQQIQVKEDTEVQHPQSEELKKQQKEDELKKQQKEDELKKQQKEDELKKQQKEDELKKQQKEDELKKQQKEDELKKQQKEDELKKQQKEEKESYSQQKVDEAERKD